MTSVPDRCRGPEAGRTKLPPPGRCTDVTHRPAVGHVDTRVQNAVNAWPTESTEGPWILVMTNRYRNRATVRVGAALDVEVVVDPRVGPDCAGEVTGLDWAAVGPASEDEFFAK